MGCHVRDMPGDATISLSDSQDQAGGDDMGTTSPIPRPSGADVRRITVDEYQAMIDARIFTDGEKLDLIEGMLVRKMTKKRRHTAGSEMVRQAIERVLPRG